MHPSAVCNLKSFKGKRRLVADVHPLVSVEEHRKMPSPQLDILRRERDGSFIWMEAAQDLEGAKARLEELVAATPGEYFVFDQRCQEIVAKLTPRTANT